MSVRECDRCHANTATGGRCRRRTCVNGRYCWQHLMRDHHLRVRASNIPGGGKGLFAQRTARAARNNNGPVFRSEDTIGEYTGDRLNAAQLQQRYPGNTLGAYVVSASANNNIDARSTQTNVVRYANHCRPRNQRAGHCRHNNARFVANQRTGRVRVAATRNINQGDEIYVSYGREYWRR